MGPQGKSAKRLEKLNVGLNLKTINTLTCGPEPDQRRAFCLLLAVQNRGNKGT